MGSACGCGSSLNKAPKKVVTTQTSTETAQTTPVDNKPQATDPSSPTKNNHGDANGENHAEQTNGASNTANATPSANPNDPDYVADVKTNPVPVPENDKKGVARVEVRSVSFIGNFIFTLMFIFIIIYLHCFSPSFLLTRRLTSITWAIKSTSTRLNRPRSLSSS
jgi:hypothetical protein